jgi:hypothetical protein
MTRKTWFGIVAACILVGSQAGDFGRRSKPSEIYPPDPFVAESGLDCFDAPDSRWRTVQPMAVYWPGPGQRSYSAELQICPGRDYEGRRVQVQDEGTSEPLFTFQDDAIIRADTVRLLNTNTPQLLIVTASGGTDDREDWHVLSATKGQLREWTMPDYQSPANKFLRRHETFCCKEWNFHLRGTQLYAAAGIYREGDGNCCPTRGGVLAHLRPVEGRFELVSEKRIDIAEYYRWRDQPFCFKCTVK